MPIKRHADPGSDPSPARLRRDATLARLARTRRGAILGAGALSALLAAVVSAIAPGRSAQAKVTPSVTTATRAPRTGPTMPAAASASQLGLQPPGSAPQAPATTPTPTPQTQAAPAPVSGGS